jgi:hypothetical protein
LLGKLQGSPFPSLLVLVYPVLRDDADVHEVPKKRDYLKTLIKAARVLPEVFIVVQGVTDNKLVCIKLLKKPRDDGLTRDLETDIVRDIVGAEGSSLPQQAGGLQGLRSMPGGGRNDTRKARKAYLLRVVRSFFMVLPVSMMSSTISTFFPLRLSRSYSRLVKSSYQGSQVQGSAVLDASDASRAVHCAGLATRGCNAPAVR